LGHRRSRRGFRDCGVIFEEQLLESRAAASPLRVDTIADGTFDFANGNSAVANGIWPFPTGTGALANGSATIVNGEVA
jgi:hypothetical protein